MNFLTVFEVFEQDIQREILENEIALILIKIAQLFQGRIIVGVDEC